MVATEVGCFVLRADHPGWKWNGFGNTFKDGFRIRDAIFLVSIRQ